LAGKIVDQSNPVDIHIGKLVRARRLALGLSQQELAAPLGLTWQQVWKYETGTNRIAASRLLAIANLLRMSPGEFYEGLDPVSGQAALAELADFFATTGAIELARAFLRMTPQQRARLVDLAQVIPAS
jgi:transcriptional regulator with XRE-family HTH domain